MVIIFRHWTEKERKLLHAGISSEESESRPTVLVLDDEGFLPEGVTSPYRMLAEGGGSAVGGETETTADPLFANLLPVPKFWEIRMLFDKAEIWDDGIKQAEIAYADPAGEHCVKSVNWVMPDGFCYMTDYYDKRGRRFCSDLYGEDGKIDIRSYYASDGSVLLERIPRHDAVTWMDHGRVKGFYDSEEKFLIDFCQRYLDPEEALCFSEKKLAKELAGIPMKQAFFSSLLLKQRIGGEVLILTNSDQIEQLELLVQGLPELHFHIAARTLMSDRLMLFGQYSNVTLYPGIREADIPDLFLRCSFYLDINYYQEICDAVAEACQYGLLILGYDATIHHNEMMLSECVFRKDQTEDMIQYLKGMNTDRQLLVETVNKQWKQLEEF